MPTEYTFTLAQVQALRALYGSAKRLTERASSPANPEHVLSERLVDGADFKRLSDALEVVDQQMKGQQRGRIHSPKATRGSKTTY